MPRRNSRGRFVKSGSTRTHRRRRRSSSVALVRSAPRPIVIRERTTAVRHRRRARHHGGGSFSGGALGAGSKAALKVKAEVAGWASVLGYLETNKSDTFDKIPTFGKLPREAVVGIALHLVGRKNRHLERASVAALAVAGYKLGANGYSLEGFDEE